MSNSTNSWEIRGLGGVSAGCTACQNHEALDSTGGDNIQNSRVSYRIGRCPTGWEGVLQDGKVSYRMGKCPTG